MDLNDDGHIDILSGSYSRMEDDMAGLFQVLWGTGDGFSAAQTLTGSDGEPLIVPGTGDDTVTERICTRPTAVDIDADGDLDIVTGNFSGSFYLFEGMGEGSFFPEAELMKTGGTTLNVPTHSDPFFVDWDEDGDLDLLSGSGQGGVFLFVNMGSEEKAKFAQPTKLLPDVGYSSEMVMGDAHITGPQAATRIWVDDVDGDGKLDLLIGDSVTLHYPAQGLDAKAVREKLTAWEAEQRELTETLNSGEQSEEAMQAFNEAYTALREKREQFLRSDSTGFVWLLKQK